MVEVQAIVVRDQAGGRLRADVTLAHADTLSGRTRRDPNGARTAISDTNNKDADSGRDRKTE